MDTQEPNNEIESKEMPAETPVSKPEVKNKPNQLMPVISVAAFVILALGAIGFLYYQNQQLKTMLAKYQTPAPQATASPISTPNPTANWKTYTNTVRGYSIQYPGDWTINTSKAETKPDNVNGAELDFTKDGYKLTIIWPSAYGPSICIFDDQPKGDIPEMASLCQGNFKEFSAGTKRRLIKPEVLSDHVQWEIYSKEKTFFVTVPPTRYTAPLKYDDGTVLIMDNILSTFKPTEIKTATPTASPKTSTPSGVPSGY